jgi:plasmid stabilization system protein ParE
MRLAFHPRVAIDIARIMGYYEEVAGTRLASEFYAELRTSFAAVAKAPETHRKYSGELRRASLTRFPYHFLYRIAGDHVRVLVVRHHRRHPKVGLSRR